MAPTPQVPTGSEVVCGTQSGQGSGLAFQGLHSSYPARGVHYSLVGSFQLDAFGDSYFKCGESRHFAKDHHRALLQSARGGPRALEMAHNL